MSRDILLSLIDPDAGQPRQYFDPARLDELATSMRANGLAVPILLRPNGERFTLVHGERRYRAALALGWQTIAADVRDMTDDEAHWLALVENVQRADLSPLEEAEAYQARIAAGLTQAALAERIGKSQSYVAQKLRLLTLPAPIAFYLRRAIIGEHHARQLLRLRKTYGKDLQASFDHWKEPLAAALPEIEAWCVLVPSMLNGLRPEEDSPAWWTYATENGKVPMDNPKWRTVAEGCKAFYQYTRENGGSIPQWEAAAFWWASITILAPLSIDVLSKALDAWQERFLTALGYLSTKPEPPGSTDGDASHMLWWGYKSDIRHSRSNGLLTGQDVTARKRQTEGLKLLLQEAGHVLPSSLQSWGAGYEKYRALRHPDEQEPTG